MNNILTEKPKRLFVISYGCQMNVADSERAKGAMASCGYDAANCAEDADLIIINTCCVRESAEERVYGKIGELVHLKKKKPSLIIGIMGCMAQKEGERLIKRAPHIDFVLGTGKIGKLVDAVKTVEENRIHLTDTNLAAAYYDDAAPISDNKLSRFVPIMQGCDNFCTYCIVPYVRGREKSRPAEDVLNDIRRAVAEGAQEITLLGQNVNSYGKELGVSFAELLTKADNVPSVRRLRFMTSHPKDLNDDLIATIANGKHICEHIHLPVQHAANGVLKSMNRRYTKEHCRRLIEKIRKSLPNVSLTTDIIVGFPGETDDDFNELLAFMREVRFDSAYTFLYSPRTGTPAAKMQDQVPDEVKHERLKRLMDVQNEISLAINEKLMGMTMEVMTEGASKTHADIWSGRTRTNKIVLFPHGTEREGEFINVRITAPQTWVLKGERIDV